MEAFERLVDALESVVPGGDVLGDPASVERSLAIVARRARRGSIVVVLSDFLDLPEGTNERLVALASGGRVVVGVRVLDPAEVSFPFEGPIRLRASEGSHHVETDGATARAAYLEALERKMSSYRDAFVGHGGRFVEATTTDDAVTVVQRLLAALDGAGT